MITVQDIAHQISRDVCFVQEDPALDDLINMKDLEGDIGDLAETPAVPLSSTLRLLWIFSNSSCRRCSAIEIKHRSTI